MKFLCWIFGHDYLYPENYADLLGGVCQRCLKLTPLKNKSTTGSVIVFKRLGKDDKVKP